LRRRDALLSGVALALGSACTKTARAPGALVATVQRRRFERVVAADGLLRAVKATPITVPQDAEGPQRVIWLAADGATLKEGDVVARFDDSELRSRLADGESNRAVALAKLQNERMLLSTSQTDRQRTATTVTRNLDLSRKFQPRDAQIFSRDQILESEIDERLQVAKVEHAGSAKTVDGDVARSKIKMVGVEAGTAAAAIKRAREGLSRLEARAPHGGLFMLRRTWMGEMVKTGDTLWPSESFAEVPMVAEMEAEVFVLEADASGLAQGKKAVVIIEAQPHHPLQAEVVRVETVAKRRQRKSPTQYFAVVLGFKTTDPTLMKPGQRVRAKLTLTQEDALVVPRPALFDRDGKWVAFRLEGGRFVPAPVKLGSSTAGLVAITEGLRENDVVSLRDPELSVEDILAAPATRSGNGQ